MVECEKPLFQQVVCMSKPQYFSSVRNRMTAQKMSGCEGFASAGWENENAAVAFFSVPLRQFVQGTALVDLWIPLAALASGLRKIVLPEPLACLLVGFRHVISLCHREAESIPDILPPTKLGN